MPPTKSVCRGRLSYCLTLNARHSVYRLSGIFSITSQKLPASCPPWQRAAELLCRGKISSYPTFNARHSVYRLSGIFCTLSQKLPASCPPWQWSGIFCTLSQKLPASCPPWQRAAELLCTHDRMSGQRSCFAVIGYHIYEH